MTHISQSAGLERTRFAAVRLENEERLSFTISRARSIEAEMVTDENITRVVF